MCFGFHFYIADSREQGIREAAKSYEENMKMFGELRLVRALSDEQIEIMRDPKRAPHAKLPRIEDAIKAGGGLWRAPGHETVPPQRPKERLARLPPPSGPAPGGVPDCSCARH